MKCTGCDTLKCTGLYRNGMYHPYHFEMYRLADENQVPVGAGIRRVALS